MPHAAFEIVANIPNRLGEGPIWHSDESVLYWTDITGRKVHRFDPATGVADTVYEGEYQIGAITIQADGSLSFFGDGTRIWTLSDGQLTTASPGIPGEEGSRFNDVFADSHGRVFAGSMPHNGQLGHLYRIDPDLSHRPVANEISCSNGMALTPSGDELYFIDSPTRRVDAFAYDPQTGDLGDRRPVVQFAEEDGVPDGMTVDGNGDLWVALWGGWSVRRYSPDGAEQERIALPAANVTCPTILPDGRMFVTTAEGPGDAAGALFLIRLDVPGVPENRSRLGL